MHEQKIFKSKKGCILNYIAISINPLNLNLGVMISWHDRQALNLYLKCNKKLITPQRKQTANLCPRLEALFYTKQVFKASIWASISIKSA